MCKRSILLQLLGLSLQFVFVTQAQAVQLGSNILSLCGLHLFIGLGIDASLDTLQPEVSNL